jgi:excisionase family DNA binding protein
MTQREQYLRTSEVARMLHVSPKTVSRWAKEGRLPYLATLGGHRRFPASEMERLLDRLSKLRKDGFQIA